MKLSFGLFALAAAQEVYDPENCTNGNNRCDGTVSQLMLKPGNFDFNSAHKSSFNVNLVKIAESIEHVALYKKPVS